MSARKAQRAAVAVLAVTGLVPLGVAGVPAAAGPDLPGVVVNEVSQRVNPDWVELYNPGDEVVDLSGWKLQDDQDRGPEDYVFPAGTVIPAGWYLVLDAAEDDTPGFEFGLGAADTVRLSDAGGGLVDSLSWTEHAATSYGRCPDGTGEVRQTATATRGEANDCTSPVRINEVAAGFVELVDPSGAGVDLDGLVVRAAGAGGGYEVPAGSLAPGELVVIDADALGFAPGEVSGVELVDGDGAVADEHGWDALPEPSTGRCPDGTGAFTVTASATPGGPNDCVPVAGQDVVRVNEVESSDGVPGDWIELVNTGAEPVDLSGWLVRDNDDTRFSTIAAGTVIAPGGFYVHEEAALGFGLGGADMARLYTPNGTLVDGYAWDEHAPATYGRCPDGTGEFRATTTPAKGAPNHCDGDPEPEPEPDPGSPWPGGPEITVVDLADDFDGDLSGLDHQDGVLWAVDNGRGQLHRLEWDGGAWRNSADDGWAAGKPLRYPGGVGTPDSEGVTVTGDGSVVVGTERDNDADDLSQLSLLRFDVSGAEPSLTASAEWDLTPQLPPTGPNTGIEAVEWVPDDVLTGLGFADASAGAAYDPDGYAPHGGGVYFVGIEGTGLVYAYLLLDGGDVHRLAELDPGLGGVMALDFDLATDTLWVVCDDGCDGASALLRVGADGAFAATGRVARPGGMANLNTEGFAITPVEHCVDGLRPVYWSDDNDTDGHSLRAGTLPCPDPEEPGEPGEPGDEAGEPEEPGDEAGDPGDAGSDGGDTGSDGGDTGAEALPDTGGAAGPLLVVGVLLALAGVALAAAGRWRGGFGPS
ncbi:lamin tail domain-containing protein [Jiangella endophytica]|uniref:lamin tail domain-containing protein n=1 Tax=Jiangella endophytica TaxID=1623398 RepID=UPI000E34BB17|nr:lamin tail domain-containing protein [Jiangella endophytica]